MPLIFKSHAISSRLDSRWTVAFCSFIGMIHAPSVALFPAEGIPFGIVYLAAAAWLVAKGLLFRQDRQGGKPAGGTLH